MVTSEFKAEKIFVNWSEEITPLSDDVKLVSKLFPFSNIYGSDCTNKVSCSIMSGSNKNNIAIETAMKEK